MPSTDYMELMKLYARRGVDDWKQAPRALHSTASKCLGGGAIAEHIAEAIIAIQTIYNGKNVEQLRFIPMPKHSHKGIERCFFLPIREIKPGCAETVAFDLFLLVTGNQCLGFRFEPAHPGQTIHNYGHVQLCRKMLRKTIEVTGIPSWMPDTHPAFPVLTSDPLKVFLCMITAVHGYDAGCTTVLRDIFASRPGELKLYLNELSAMLV